MLGTGDGGVWGVGESLRTRIGREWRKEGGTKEGEGGII